MLLHEVVAGAIYATVHESGYHDYFPIKGYSANDIESTVCFLGFQEAFEILECDDEEGNVNIHYVYQYGDGTLHEPDSEMYCEYTVEQDDYYKNLSSCWHDLYRKVRKW